MISRMTELEDRVRQQRPPSARWQQRLSEGAPDVANDLDHELRDRLAIRRPHGRRPCRGRSR